MLFGFILDVAGMIWREWRRFKKCADTGKNVHERKNMQSPTALKFRPPMRPAV